MSKNKNRAKLISLAVLSIPVIYSFIPETARTNQLNEPIAFESVSAIQAFTPPATVRNTLPSVLKLDAMALNVIAQSEALAIARLNTQVQIEADKINKNNEEANNNKLTVLNNGGYSKQNNEPVYLVPTPVIDRIKLNGLISNSYGTRAYLVIDNNNIRVAAGEVLAGVLIAKITSDQVTLKHGNKTKTLEVQ